MICGWFRMMCMICEEDFRNEKIVCGIFPLMYFPLDTIKFAVVARNIGMVDWLWIWFLFGKVGESEVH